MPDNRVTLLTEFEDSYVAPVVFSLIKDPQRGWNYKTDVRQAFSASRRTRCRFILPDSGEVTPLQVFSDSQNVTPLTSETWIVERSLQDPSFTAHFIFGTADMNTLYDAEFTISLAPLNPILHKLVFLLPESDALLTLSGATITEADPMKVTGPTVNDDLFHITKRFTIRADDLMPEVKIVLLFNDVVNPTNANYRNFSIAAVADLRFSDR